MAEGEDTPLVRVAMGGEKLKLTARKDGGWFEEIKRVKYDGPDLAFEVNPKFLVDALAKTNKVKIGDGKLKLELDKIQFVVCLEMKDGA